MNGIAICWKQEAFCCYPVLPLPKAFTNPYLQGVYEDVCKKNAHAPEFIQAAGEVLESLTPDAGPARRNAAWIPGKPFPTE